MRAPWILLTAVVLHGCSRDKDGLAVFSEGEMREVKKLSPLSEPPESLTNVVADNQDAALLGKLLFFDSRLSANGEISCATCHDPELGFSDAKPLSEGIESTTRHSPALWNLAYQRWFFWDGRADSLWAQSLQPLLSEVEMGATAQQVQQVVSNDHELAKAYTAVFGSPPNEEKSIDQFLSNLGKSIAAFQRQIVSRDAPFDRFVAQLQVGGKSEDLNPNAQRGLKLFVGRGKCVLCHAGPNFSDGEFHNIGLPMLPESPRDLGRYSGIPKVLDDRFNGLGEFSDDSSAETNVKIRYLVVKTNNLGEFKTPTLRHIAKTAPYMHDGRFATLREVLEFYSKLPGRPPFGHREETLEPLDFTTREMDDLEAFLESLTGSPLSLP